MLRKGDVVICTDLYGFTGITFRLSENYPISSNVIRCIFLKDAGSYVKGESIYLHKDYLSKIDNKTLINNKIKSLEQRHKDFIIKRNNKCAA